MSRLKREVEAWREEIGRLVRRETFRLEGDKDRERGKKSALPWPITRRIWQKP